MSNAPLILTLDCDTYSNDPRSPLHALCYFLDPAMSSNLAFVQFPQIFQGLNKNDIYATEVKRLYTINPRGKDGLGGPNYVGTGCYFARRSLQGNTLPSSLSRQPIDSISSEFVMRKAHEVTSCTYELGSKWGTKVTLIHMFVFPALHLLFCFCCWLLINWLPRHLLTCRLASATGHYRRTSIQAYTCTVKDGTRCFATPRSQLFSVMYRRI